MLQALGSSSDRRGDSGDELGAVDVVRRQTPHADGAHADARQHLDGLGQMRHRRPGEDDLRRDRHPASTQARIARCAVFSAPV